jgi:hypothetical protein
MGANFQAACLMAARATGVDWLINDGAVQTPHAQGSLGHEARTRYRERMSLLLNAMETLSLS